MPVEFRISDQLLTVDDSTNEVEAIVHKYDAFLNLLCSDSHQFLREAMREALRFMVSSKYSDLETLAWENWTGNSALSLRNQNIDEFLGRMPLKDRKSASIDLATGTGKSWVLYGLSAIALAEGLADRVLVLCPSLTIEGELLEKFSSFASDPQLADIMVDLGAVHAIPAIKRGSETIQIGDICVENINAVYENTGSSIEDSFKGKGDRVLVLNDEAHHVFSNVAGDGMAETKWLEFLKDETYGFRYIFNVTGTPYTGNDYFPDVIYRFGLKQAIEAGVVKKPDYVVEDTFHAQTWDQIWQVHQYNIETYGNALHPLSIVVTADIARCVEVSRELVDFLTTKEDITQEEALEKVIWVTSTIPSSGAGKQRVEAAFLPREADEKPEKQRKENISRLKKVDEPSSPVEWIVSVGMLTEGWDVKNVFQVVPHESRAFHSKLLIDQVLGRGLRVPKGLDHQPLVKITNHEAWSDEIARLLKEVLEVENTLSTGFSPRRDHYTFPLHNLTYESELHTVETKREKATEIKVTLRPQSRSSTEYTTFSETGKLAAEITHDDQVDLEDAVRVLRLFIRDRDAEIAKAWSKDRIREFIQDALTAGGHEGGFLSRENLSLVQQAFGPLFRPVDRKHPRMKHVAKNLVTVDYRTAPRQSFSESRLKESGNIYFADDGVCPVTDDETHLWEQYCRWVKIAKIDESGMSEEAKIIAGKLHPIATEKFKTPNNLHYASHEPERLFTELLFENTELIESFINMPDQGGYSFPYSYKPTKNGKTHAVNENFNPDLFIRLIGSQNILAVEIKHDKDDSRRNAAKLRDGKKHFAQLNDTLEKAGEDWRYFFYFLSPTDYSAFFDILKNGSYEGWNSTLMANLENSGD